MAFGIKNVLQGALGNYSAVDIGTLEKDYGMYLMDGESITMGFKLIRDALIFTNKRIILSDKQGATGTKTRIKSINLFSLVDVTMETSGFGFDDSELTFTYISSHDLKGHQVQYASHKLEFPKQFNVQGLYKILQTLAYENCLRVNNITE